MTRIREIDDEFINICNNTRHCYECPLKYDNKNPNVCESVFFYRKAIDDFQEWLKKQIVGIDNKTKEILVVRDDRWELATEEFKKDL